MTDGQVGADGARAPEKCVLTGVGSEGTGRGEWGYMEKTTRPTIKIVT